MSTDFGTDQDSVQALLKKTDALDLDIDNFHNNIGELAALCQGLVQRKHFDSENIQSKQVGRRRVCGKRGASKNILCVVLGISY